MTRCLRLLALAVILGAVSIAQGQTVSAPVVAVPEFYSGTLIGPVTWIYPETQAAEDLASLLPRSPNRTFAPLSWASVARAEASLHWRPWDQSSTTRLNDLANALGADYLVVGEFRLFVMNYPRDCSHDDGCGGNGPIMATAIIRLSVYGRQAGRIVATIPDAVGRALGTVAPEVAREVIDSALQTALPGLVHELNALSAHAPM